MIEGNTRAFSAGRRRVVGAAVLTLGLTAAAAAFAVGYTGALKEGLAGPASAQHMRLAALEQLDTSLGYGGFLKFYGAFLATGDRTPETEFRRLAGEADASLLAFARASTSEADVTSATLLRGLEAPFRRAAVYGTGNTFTPGGVIPAAELERDYAALKTAIAAAAGAADRGRLDILIGALAWAEAFFIGVLLFLSMALIVLAWLLRERLIAPVEALLESMAAASANGMPQPLWGIDRRDDIGAIARAAERLRRNVVPNADPVPPLQLKIMEQLTQSAAQLESEMAKTATSIQQACLNIEEAGVRVAEAGQAAIEAAALLSRPAAQSQQRDGNERSSLPQIQDGDAAAVLESLSGGLDALERYARERHNIEGDRLVPFSWALFRAVDRLNAVALTLSGSDDSPPLRVAQ